MLKVLRKRKRSWIISLVLGAIILVFIFWGIGTLRVDKRTIAARVNGKPITAAEYAKAYQQQLNYYRNVLKDQFNDELLEKLNLKQNTIQSLINTELQLKKAKTQGIAASTEEIQKRIASVQAFQKDGAFDKNQYLQVLKVNRILPGDYEKEVENTLVLEKLQKKATDAVSVNDKDAKAHFDAENKKSSFQYIEIDETKLKKDVPVSDEEAKTYFEKNKASLGELYNVPTKVKAAYVSIPFKDFLQKIKVSEAALKEYYEKNINEFQMQKQVSARHILIRPSLGASDINKSKEEARKKAEEILALLKKGENFAELAKKYSDDKTSAQQGGSLGYFKQGEMVKPFEDAAFSLKKGGISNIVETEFGYHIIKVEDVKEARLIPFKEAKDGIIKKLSREAAKKLAAQLSSEIEKAVNVGKRDLKDAASKRKLKVVETDFFSERDAGAELVKNEGLKNTVFSLKAGEISSAAETADGIYIIKMIDRKEGHPPIYEEAASLVKEAMQKQRTRKKLKGLADDVLRRLQAGEDLQRLASRQGYKTGESGFITKTEGYISKIGLYVGDKPDIFFLKKESPYYREPVRQGEKFFILKLKQSKDADMAEFEAKKSDIKNRLLKQKQQEALIKWLNELKSKAKIEINQEAM